MSTGTMDTPSWPTTLSMTLSETGVMAAKAVKGTNIKTAAIKNNFFI